MLDYQYKISSIRQKGINVLNGVGLNRFILLKNANDKLKPGEEFDFFIVNASVVFETTQDVSFEEDFVIHSDG